MRQSFPSLRKAAVFVIAVFSVLCAVALVWLAVRRETIGNLTNAHLAGMVALFLLPAATLAAWDLDRRAAQRWISDGEETAEESEAKERLPRKHTVSPGVPRRLHAEESRHRRRVEHGATVGR